MNLRKNRIYRKRVYKTGAIFGIGPTTTRYLVLILLAVFSLLYLVQSAQGQDRAIDIRTEETKQTGLQREMTDLEVQSSRLQSIQNLNQSAQTNGLVPITGTPETLDLSVQP